MNDQQKYWLIQGLIVVIALLFFFPFLGRVHLFDWDEINFAEMAREMIVTGDYLNVQIDYQIFWEKPPFFAWLQVLSMKYFGVGEYAARFPNAVCGLLSLLVLFNIGRQLKDTRFGLLWALAYIGSLLPQLYFKSGLIDPWFNLFIFLAVYFFLRYTSPKRGSQRLIHAMLSAVMIGLAVLTKGPVGFLLFALTASVFYALHLYRRKRQADKNLPPLYIKLSHVSIYFLVCGIVGGLWFILQALSGNTQILIDFIDYHIRLFQTRDAGHGGFVGYHVVVLLLGVFPASFLALPAFRRSHTDPDLAHARQWMLILFWVVLIVFSIVRTKIVHYSSLCYFPLTFLAAYSIYHALHHRRILTILLMVFGSFWALLVVGLQYFVANKEQLIAQGLIPDPFAVANLQADVYWSGYEFLVGVFLIIALIVSLFIVKKSWRAIALLVSMALFTNILILSITARIEGYSQRAAIEFYKSKQGKSCYVQTLGFKSYAHLFYFRKPEPEHDLSSDKHWLLYGKIDKPVYFVSKNTKADQEQQKHPHLERLYEKNGFVFFRRNLSQP